jgi:hypothetical protein
MAAFASYIEGLRGRGHMSNPSQDRGALQVRQRQRYQFLHAVFDATEGNCMPSLNMWDVGKALGFSHAETSDVQSYLYQEGLIENFALGGEIRLTHRGLREVEASLETPTERTEHFSVDVIQHVTTYNGPVVNQSGSHNVANVTHTVGIGGDKLASLIDSIRQVATGLALEQREDVIQLVEVVEAEARSTKPRLAMLKTAINGLTSIAKSAAALATPLSELAKLVLP